MWDFQEVWFCGLSSLALYPQRFIKLSLGELKCFVQECYLLVLPICRIKPLGIPQGLWTNATQAVFNLLTWAGTYLRILFIFKQWFRNSLATSVFSIIFLCLAFKEYNHFPIQVIFFHSRTVGYVNTAFSLSEQQQQNRHWPVTMLFSVLIIRNPSPVFLAISVCLLQGAYPHMNQSLSLSLSQSHCSHSMNTEKRKATRAQLVSPVS